jgi:hypothetical protein
MTLQNFGVLYFFLRISREDGNLAYKATVDLSRHRSTLAPDLWDPRTTFYGVSCKGNELWCSEQIPSEREFPDFSEYLNRSLDKFIVFIRNRGGIRKYLPKSPPSVEAI